MERDDWASPLNQIKGMGRNGWTNFIFICLGLVKVWAKLLNALDQKI